MLSWFVWPTVGGWEISKVAGLHPRQATLQAAVRFTGHDVTLTFGLKVFLQKTTAKFHLKDLKCVTQ